MSYEVFALKYRPQTFADVVGQQSVAQTLARGVRTSRVANAYLFCGSRGVGKTSMARILAKALNCPNTKDGEPCNACEVCESIAAGEDIDVIEIDGASKWMTFREIIWPQVLPIAATVMLIRVIEAFKIVDLPNIMTAGGPGIATESVSLQSYYAWRALDLGQASAVAYILLFITVVICVSFFNLVVLARVRAKP